MSHLDSDRLVLLALGERPTDDSEAVHLAGCRLCQGEVDLLRQVATVARDTEEVRGLAAPPARVWQEIARQTIEPTGPPRNRPRQRSRRRWVRPAVLAVATAAVAIAGTIGITAALNRDRAEVSATADLAALAEAPAGAHGRARVLAESGGERLHLHITGLPLRPGYYEVWLINPDTGRMISVGVLGGPDALLPLPSTVDLHAYRLVDISAEDYDGDTAHSGNSLLRGTLTN